MIGANYVFKFEKVKKELKQNGFFLILDDNDYIVGELKYQKKWYKLLEELEHEAPIYVCCDLEEAKAFAIGVGLGQKKKWRY